MDISDSGAGTGTGMGKIIQKQAKMERISQYSINEKPLFWTLLNVANSIKRRVGVERKDKENNGGLPSFWWEAFVGDKKYGYYIQEATISTYTILGRQ